MFADYQGGICFGRHKHGGRKQVTIKSAGCAVNTPQSASAHGKNDHNKCWNFSSVVAQHKYATNSVDDEIQRYVRLPNRERNVEEAERHAHQLRREARGLFEHARLLKQRDEEAQQEAADMAAQANRIAQDALNKHLEGQEKLALAAQKMLEAGSLLQKEASSVTVAEVPYNRHELMNIHQGIGVEGAEIRDFKQDMKVVRETELIGDGQFRETEGAGDRHFRRERHEDQLADGGRHFREEGREYAGGEHRFSSGGGYETREKQLLGKTEERGAAAGEAESYRHQESRKIR